MKFKTTKQQMEYDTQVIWPLLKEILRDAEEFAIDNGCGDLTITSIFRTPEEDAELHGSGIHCIFRAADVRIPCWDDPKSLTLARYINAKYVYDSSRPTLLVAFMEPHGDGPHCHFQVSSFTKLRHK